MSVSLKIESTIDMVYLLTEWTLWLRKGFYQEKCIS